MTSVPYFPSINLKYNKIHLKLVKDKINLKADEDEDFNLPSLSLKTFAEGKLQYLYRVTLETEDGSPLENNLGFESKMTLDVERSRLSIFRNTEPFEDIYYSDVNQKKPGLWVSTSYEAGLDSLALTASGNLRGRHQSITFPINQVSNFGILIDSVRNSHIPFEVDKMSREAFQSQRIRFYNLPVGNYKMKVCIEKFAEIIPISQAEYNTLWINKPDTCWGLIVNDPWVSDLFFAGKIISSASEVQKVDLEIAVVENSSTNIDDEILLSNV